MYYVRKVGILIAMMWVGVTMNFFIPRMIPGNPADAYIARMRGEISPLMLRALEAEFGISHAPLWQQYLVYLGHLLHGNWGISSLYYPESVLTVIGQALPWTLGLLGIMTLCSFVVGTVLGILNAWKRSGIMDTIVSPALMFFQAVPGFWLGLMLLWYFGLILGWFPIDHSYSIGVTPALTLSFIMDVVHHAVLPGVTLFVTSLGGWMLLMRNNMIQTLGDDFMVLATAKGLKQNRLRINYAARNAILPVFTNFALALATIVGGSVLIEEIFAYPGVGYQLVQAVESQDYSLAQGLFLIFTISVLLVNFVVDLLYGKLDPRTAHSEGD